MTARILFHGKDSCCHTAASGAIRQSALFSVEMLQNVHEPGKRTEDAQAFLRHVFCDDRSFDLAVDASVNNRQQRVVGDRH